MDLQPYRLPRSLESLSGASDLLERLARTSRPLRPGGDLTVPTVQFDDGLGDALRSANLSRRLVRGLEAAEEKLESEARGLGKAGAAVRGERVTRLLVLSSDGGDAFHRRIETLLQRHYPRLMAVRLDVDGEALAAPLFGAGRSAKLLLVSHKDAVTTVLSAVAEALSRND